MTEEAVMEAKHYEMLGSNLRRIISSTRFTELNDELVGRMMVQYVEMVELEAERDARDQRNGKGE
jgi:hypothetical protein